MACAGKRVTEPVYAPFVAAGFFFTRGEFLNEVPFDPLLPWIFMVSLVVTALCV